MSPNWKHVRVAYICVPTEAVPDDEFRLVHDVRDECLRQARAVSDPPDRVYRIRPAAGRGDGQDDQGKMEQLKRDIARALIGDTVGHGLYGTVDLHVFGRDVASTKRFLASTNVLALPWCAVHVHADLVGADGDEDGDGAEDGGDTLAALCSRGCADVLSATRRASRRPRGGHRASQEYVVTLDLAADSRGRRCSETRCSRRLQKALGTLVDAVNVRVGNCIVHDVGAGSRVLTAVLKAPAGCAMQPGAARGLRVYAYPPRVMLLRTAAGPVLFSAVYLVFAQHRRSSPQSEGRLLTYTLHDDALVECSTVRYSSKRDLDAYAVAPQTHAQMTRAGVAYRPEELHPVGLCAVQRHHLSCHGMRHAEEIMMNGRDLFARGHALVHKLVAENAAAFAPCASCSDMGASAASATVHHRCFGVRLVFSNEHTDAGRCWVADVHRAYVPWHGSPATSSFARRAYALMYGALSGLV